MTEEEEEASAQTQMTEEEEEEEEEQQQEQQGARKEGTEDLECTLICSGRCSWCFWMPCTT